MKIEFIARATNNSKIKVSAGTAKEAVELFLKLSKTRNFYVNEYRNGCFRMVIGGEGGYFRKSFNSRQEAINFIKSN
jgi:hypothetical protein